MTRLQANILLLAAAVLWGGCNFAQQTILGHMGPIAASGLRAAIAALVVLPLALRSEPGRAPLDPDGLRLAVEAVASFGAAMTLMQAAFGLTSVTNASFFGNTSTVITPALALLVMGARVPLLAWPAGALCLVGIVMMGGGAVATLNAGDLLSLAAAVFYAYWMVALTEFVSRHGRACLITVWQFAAVAIVCLPAALLAEAPSLAGIAAAWPELLLLGVVSTGGGYLLMGLAQKRATASETAVIISLEAVFGAAGAWLVLGETFTSLTLVGATLILIGVVVVQLPVPALALSRKR
jgi:drug/metabolite transporter (DMT)-like permease